MDHLARRSLQAAREERRTKSAERRKHPGDAWLDTSSSARVPSSAGSGYGSGYKIKIIPSLPGWQVQAERLRRHLIQRGFACVLRDHTEVAVVVPHGPADVVALQRNPHVLDPGVAVLRFGEI